MAGDYLPGMERQIITLFSAWKRRNVARTKKPSGQDAVQFFTDTTIAGEMPEGWTWLREKGKCP